jgi:hypothetical protein
MGSKAKRRAIDDFIRTGELRIDPANELPTDRAPDSPLDDAWLADIKQHRARLAADPTGELPEYRDFYKRPDLSQAEVDHLLFAMERAVGTPEAFYDDMADAWAQQPVGDPPPGKISLGCAMKIPWLYPTRPPSADQQAAIGRLRDEYRIDPTIEINPNEHHFEVCDPAWWPLWKTHLVTMRGWPVGLAPFIEHDASHTFVYDDRRAATHVALFADFGVGHYHSFLIAKQLEAKRYPYVFHLGDVYYAGGAEEFAYRYANVLAGVMQHSLLFSMPENHELYGGGTAWQQFIRASQPRILQEGSYFCVRFAKHQIIGLDVNWHGRQRFTYTPCREWLEHVLETGGGRTNILLTGSAPFRHGVRAYTELHDDLALWHQQGKFALWFWGDDHYCALFQRRVGRANFVGSCIGHGGFPGERELPVPDLMQPVDVEWLEDEPRFPRGYGLRDDLGNNGWVELAMLPSGGVELLYVDWLGCKRYRIRYELDPAAPGQLAPAEREAFAKRAL